MNLILGTANFGCDYGVRLDKKKAHKILDYALELGVWALDTAPTYGRSEEIIRAWPNRNKMLIFSKGTSKNKPTIGDQILLHDEKELGFGLEGYSGVSLYNHALASGLVGTCWIQAPFNPLNHEFSDMAGEELFIARSVFLRGSFRNSDRQTIAKLTFGFLRSHKVKNVVFGVESLDDLETNVFAARDARTVDTRLV